jgi:site-specific recombinase XerD
MDMTNAVLNYRRFMKRRNYSTHTVKNYMHCLKHFILWLSVPVEETKPQEISAYVEYLWRRGLSPKTINSCLDSIRGFYHYLREEENIPLPNPVRSLHAVRLSRPLPRCLRDGDVAKLFATIASHRDRAMFLLMLRCGLRVEEVANLTVSALDVRRRKLFVHNGKGQKDRVVYLSNDASTALVEYLRVRGRAHTTKVFLVGKGTYTGQAISVRGIQKRMEYYAKKSGVTVSCHHLRHTMATQLLNADADLVTIQDLLGHSKIKTTQRYCKVSNLKVQRDYHKAMEVIMHKSYFT